MMTFVATVAAAAALLAAGALTNRADAMTLGSGLRHAIEDTDLTDKVHCRWGYPHHLRRWGWWDGCYRGLRRGFVSAPLVVYAGPRRYWRRRGW